MTKEEQDEFEQLKAENEALKAGKARPLSLKVSAKGAVSLYGLGRFPVTLYKEQWEKVLGMSGEIEAFLVAHVAELKTRDDAS